MGIDNTSSHRPDDGTQDKHADQPAVRHDNFARTSSTRRPESTLTRDEYSARVRGQETPARRHDAPAHAGQDKRAERAAPRQDSGNSRTGSQRPESTLTRDEYSARVRADAHGTSRSADTRHASPEHDRGEDRVRETRSTIQLGDRLPAEVTSGHGDTSPAIGSVGKGEIPAEGASQSADVPVTGASADGKPKDRPQPGDDLPSQADLDRLHALYQDYLKEASVDRGPKPERVSADGKEIEVTHAAADGIWVEGLPGEAPDRIGDVLRSPEDREQRRAEKLRKELNKEAEGVVDVGGKWADTVQDLFDRNPPPTHTATHDRSPDTAPAGPEHGFNAGHTVEAALTLAVVGVAAVHKVHELWRGARERRLERREDDNASN